MKVTVYTTPNCPQCQMTKKVMDRKGIIYETVDLTEQPDKLTEFKSKGYLAAPIVTTDTKIWSGFRLNKIESLANHLFSENRGKLTDKETVLKAAELISNPEWNGDFNLIRYHLASWMILVANNGPLEQQVLDMANEVLNA